MNRLLVGSLIGSMLALAPYVNSQETVSATSKNSGIKTAVDDVRDTNQDVAQLIDFLLKNGEDRFFKEHLAPAIGLPGPMPAKGRTISQERHGKDISVHECYLVYEKSADTAANLSKHPVCLYLKKHSVSGQDDQAKFFRVDLQGRLEKVVMIVSKRDTGGKIVPGASVAFNQDIESSESKKEFNAEMFAMKKWLKAQRKLLLAKSSASAAGAPAASTAAAP